MIEQVEEFASELQIDVLPHLEVFHSGKVGIHESRAIERRPISVPEFSCRSIYEATRIEEPLYRGVADMAAADLVRAINVAGKTYARIVAAGHHEQRKSGSRFFNYVDLPPSQGGIGHSVPGTAEVLPSAEGQIINHASREAMIQLDLGQRPVRSLGIWERVVSGAGAGTYTIGKPGIEIAGISVAQKCVHPVPGALGFRFHLQRIVARRTDIVDVRYGRKLWVGSRTGAESTAESVAGHGAACAGRGNVQIHAINQDVSAT